MAIHPWAEEPMTEPLERRTRRWKIECYLKNLHCVIWPDAHWDLTDEKERAQAVAFIEALMDSVA